MIVKPSNLKLLHRIASPSAPTQTVSEALRCIANALLLVESGRDAWLEVGGGKLCLQYLQDPKTNEEFCFLNGRILFLSTLKQCEFLKNTVEDEKIMECIADVSKQGSHLSSTDSSSLLLAMRNSLRGQCGL